MMKTKYLLLGAIATTLLLGACGNKKEAAAVDETATNEAAPLVINEMPETTEDVAVNEVATNKTAQKEETPEVKKEEPKKDEATANPALASLPAPYKTADLANGEKQFALCKACHTLSKTGRNGVGPDLYGVIGRKAGTAEGFNYSDAMKESGKVWSVTSLDSYLKAPKTFVSGNKMAFAGIQNDKNRKDIIAYIAVKNAE